MARARWAAGYRRRVEATRPQNRGDKTLINRRSDRMGPESTGIDREFYRPSRFLTSSRGMVAVCLARASSKAINLG
jgi:hypothetical protein